MNKQNYYKKIFIVFEESIIEEHDIYVEEIEYNEDGEMLIDYVFSSQGDAILDIGQTVQGYPIDMYSVDIEIFTGDEIHDIYYCSAYFKVPELEHRVLYNPRSLYPYEYQIPNYPKYQTLDQLISKHEVINDELKTELHPFPSTSSNDLNNPKSTLNKDSFQNTPKDIVVALLVSAYGYLELQTNLLNQYEQVFQSSNNLIESYEKVLNEYGLLELDSTNFELTEIEELDDCTFIIEGRITKIKYQRDDVQFLSFGIGEENAKANLLPGDVIQLENRPEDTKHYFHEDYVYKLKVKRTNSHRYGVVHTIQKYEIVTESDQSPLEYLISKMTSVPEELTVEGTIDRIVSVETGETSYVFYVYETFDRIQFAKELRVFSSTPNLMLNLSYQLQLQKIPSVFGNHYSVLEAGEPFLDKKDVEKYISTNTQKLGPVTGKRLFEYFQPQLEELSDNPLLLVEVAKQLRDKVSWNNKNYKSKITKTTWSEAYESALTQISPDKIEISSEMEM